MQGASPLPPHGSEKKCPASDLVKTHRLLRAVPIRNTTQTTSTLREAHVSPSRYLHARRLPEEDTADTTNTCLKSRIER